MKLITRSTEETYALAQKIAQELNGGEVILLNGTLGAGKTTFTKGLALALGVKNTKGKSCISITSICIGLRTTTSLKSLA